MAIETPPEMDESIGGTPAEQVRGLLATDQAPPNDADIKSLLAEALEEKHLTSTERLRGILDLGDPPMTKEQIRNIITDELIKKYR